MLAAFSRQRFYDYRQMFAVKHLAGIFKCYTATKCGGKDCIRLSVALFVAAGYRKSRYSHFFSGKYTCHDGF
ncbi:hypothetical protein HK14_04710 [Acetobacter cibinongensis]|uniref:Uncharacterized protein n=2 Tax=Acetobacter cibinongensis TaxID=146475 RepID=A0A1Z5YVF8_9PROT|nr:hypothetical protein HK14_04710 [Acetobacter cibinongensis]